jgi:hypothetical protein
VLAPSQVMTPIARCEIRLSSVPTMVVPGVPPWVTQSQPLGTQERGSGDVWAVLTRLSQLSAPTHQLEAGGG